MNDPRLCFDCPLFNVGTRTHGNYLPLQVIQRSCDDFKKCKRALLRTQGITLHKSTIKIPYDI